MAVHLTALAVAAVLCWRGSRCCFRGDLGQGLLTGVGGVLAFGLALVAGVGVSSESGGVDASPPTLATRPLASRQPAPGPGVQAVLRRIALCESGGSPTSISASGQYRGKYQFDVSTWASVGGRGDPALATEAEQDRRASRLLHARGTQPWPTCGRAR